MSEKIKCTILGRGEEQVTVNKNQTIKDLRDMLALDEDVQAFDDDGNVLSADSQVANNVNFIPNVEGGR